MLVATSLLIVVFSPLVIARPVDAVRAVGPTWDRTYVPTLGGGQNSEQTRDGGFIMSALSSGVWVMKANPAGLPEWQREYSPLTCAVYSDPRGRVTQTSDGGYIVAGSALGPKHTGTGCGGDAWLLKLDHRGSVAWSRVYDMPGFEFFNSALPTSDGGYIALGEWASQTWLVKLSSTGDIEWQKAYPVDGFPYSVQETSDGGFIVAESLALNNGQRAWLLKTDALGNTVWQKAYAVPTGTTVIDDHAYWIVQTSDGGYSVLADVIDWGHPVGSPYVNIALFSHAWILRLDSQGDIVWQKLVSGGGFTQSSSISEVSDGGFIVAGRFLQANPSGEVGGTFVGVTGPFLLTLVVIRNLVWRKNHSGGNDILAQAHETTDGGIIAVGSCCGDFVWAMKLDVNGDVRGCPVGVPSNATLTETNSIVTDTTITSVDTNASVTPVDVTVTTPSFPVQDQCMATPSTKQG